MTDSVEVTEEEFIWTQCDRCSAQAWVVVKLMDGELTFCSHHYNRYKDNLDKVVYETLDYRHLINAKSESSA